MSWKAVGIASLLGLVASNLVDRRTRSPAYSSPARISKARAQSKSVLTSAQRDTSRNEWRTDDLRSSSRPALPAPPAPNSDLRNVNLLLTSLTKSISTDTQSEEKTIHRNTVNSTPLMHAAAKGDLSKMRSYMHLARKTDSRGMTALMYAAYYNQARVMSMLISEEARMQDKSGKTALMYAAQQGATAAVDILVPYEKGLVDKDSWNALMYSAVCSNMPCQALIDAEGPDLTGDNDALLKIGLESKHNKIGHNKIDNADICAIEMNILGITPLMEAAMIGDIQGVKTHLRVFRGRKDRYGTTALMYAAIGNHFECARLLRTSERREQDHEGFTALMRAAIHGHMEIISLLSADEGGMLNNIRWSAIAYVIQNDHLEGLHHLLHLEGSLHERADVGYSIFALLEHSQNPRVQAIMEYL